MVGKILVFGGTGPAGLCLLRELLYRDHSVVKGDLTDREALSKSISQSSLILSLMGPNRLRGLNPATFTNFYKLVFELMREHDVRRIFGMSTLSYWQPDDGFSVLRWLLVSLVFVVAHYAWRTARGIAQTFKDHGDGLDWTVFRIAGIPGGCDEASWKADREDGKSFEGPVGGKGWTFQQRRGALARWLVDAAEDGKAEWIGKMPAVSRLAGSNRRAD